VQPNHEYYHYFFPIPQTVSRIFNPATLLKIFDFNQLPQRKTQVHAFQNNKKYTPNANPLRFNPSLIAIVAFT